MFGYNRSDTVEEVICLTNLIFSMIEKQYLKRDNNRKYLKFRFSEALLTCRWFLKTSLEAKYFHRSFRVFDLFEFGAFFCIIVLFCIIDS